MEILVEGIKERIYDFQELILTLQGENLFHGFSISENWEGVSMPRCIGPFTIFRDTLDAISKRSAWILRFCVIHQPRGSLAISSAVSLQLMINSSCLSIMLIICVLYAI